MICGAWQCDDTRLNHLAKYAALLKIIQNEYCILYPARLIYQTKSLLNITITFTAHFEASRLSPKSLQSMTIKMLCLLT